MKTLYLLVVIITVPTTLSAQLLKVRTGEHTDFTRVVIEASPETAWTMTEDDKKITVKTRLTNEYDLSAAWERIGKARISEIKSQNENLTITKNCNCKTVAYQREDGLIVLDISNISNPTSVRLKNKGINKKTERSAPYPNPIKRSAKAIEKAIPRTIKKSKNAPVNKKNKSDNIKQDRTTDELNEFRKEIFVQLSNSATRGLLEPQLQKELQKREVKKDEKKNESMVEFQPTEMDNRSRVSDNMRTRDSITDMKSTENVLRADCDEYTDLDHKKWSETDDFVFEISRRRNEVFNDLVNHDDQSVLELAKVYLYFGFSDEAIESLELIKRKTESVKALIEIARIVQGNEFEDGQTLSRIHDCSLQAQLWLFLADNSLSLQESIDEKNIVVQVRSLPTHLRKIIGDRVRVQLFDMGFFLEADAVRRSLRNEEGNKTTIGTKGHSPADEILMIKNGILSSSIADMTKESNVAKLISEVQQLEFQELNVDVAVLELIDGLIIENRDTIYWDSLRMARKKVGIFMGEFSTAIQSIEECSTLKHLDICKELKNFIEGQYAIGSSDFDFLYHFFNTHELSQRVSNGTHAKAYRERLRNLGFDQFSHSMNSMDDTSVNEEIVGFEVVESVRRLPTEADSSVGVQASSEVQLGRPSSTHVNKEESDISKIRHNDLNGVQDLLNFEELTDDSAVLRERIQLQLNN